MTMGELARMFNGENKLSAELTVIPMQDWNRGDWFDATNLPGSIPSPNMRSLKAATLYPGLCLMECSKNCPSAAAPTRRSSRSAPISSAAANWPRI